MHAIDQNNQLLTERFTTTAHLVESNKLSIDLHMDLLIAFQDVHSFNASTFKEYELAEILAYLETTHQYYLSKALLKIRFALERLSEDKHDLSDLQKTLFQFFNYFEEDLIEHMREEEKFLFPYVARLIELKKGATGEINPNEKVKLDEFLMHHDNDSEDLLERLVVYLKSSKASYPDSMSLSILIHRLEFFMTDLQVHSLIEEQVFVPGAIALEKEMLQS